MIPAATMGDVKCRCGVRGDFKRINTLKVAKKISIGMYSTWWTLALQSGNNTNVHPAEPRKNNCPFMPVLSFFVFHSPWSEDCNTRGWPPAATWLWLWKKLPYPWGRREWEGALDPSRTHLKSRIWVCNAMYVNLGSCWCEGKSSIPNVPYIWSYARVAYVVWIQYTSAATAMEYLRHSTFSKRTSQNPQDS